MKKLNITYFFVFGLLGFTFFACDEDLNIEPEQSISTNVALSTDKGVRTALVGAYDLLSDNDVWGGGQHLSELFADDGDQIWAGTFEEPEEIFMKTILVQNGDVERMWTEGYETINLVNNILASLSVVDAADQSGIEAEAKFIRAAIYFDLVNLFGKTYVDGTPSSNPGVPIIKDPTSAITPELDVSRNSVEDVYQAIISDLTFARDNLPETNGFRATTYAASGLLSRVYLMQENYSAAQQEADRVIESGLFSLLNDYSAVFNQPGNTPEDIFTIEVTSQDGVNDFITFYASPDNGGRGDIDIREAHLDKYEDGDQRKDAFYIDENGITRTNKWVQNASQDGNINVIRLSEMYLTRGEARFRSGDLAGAVEDLNVIRERAGLTKWDESSITLDGILNERRLELAFEGHLFRDMKRTKRDIQGIPFNADRLVYPIPQRELDVNPNLTQNPGY